MGPQSSAIVKEERKSDPSQDGSGEASVREDREQSVVEDPKMGDGMLLQNCEVVDHHLYQAFAAEREARNLRSKVSVFTMHPLSLPSVSCCSNPKRSKWWWCPGNKDECQNCGIKFEAETQG